MQVNPINSIIQISAYRYLLLCLIRNCIKKEHTISCTPYSFEKTSFVYIPKEQSITIEFRINPNLNPAFLKFVAIDGVCVSPVPLGMFCEPQYKIMEYKTTSINDMIH